MSECYVKQVSFKKFFESIGVSSELNALAHSEYPGLKGHKTVCAVVDGDADIF